MHPRRNRWLTAAILGAIVLGFVNVYRQDVAVVAAIAAPAVQPAGAKASTPKPSGVASVAAPAAITQTNPSKKHRPKPTTTETSTARREYAPEWEPMTGMFDRRF